jgi:hypothetical protein
MRLAVCIVSLLLTFCFICSAGIITDPFRQNQSNCAYTSTPNYDGGCDVIGDEADYDIQMASVVISGNTATVSLFFNTDGTSGQGPNMALGPFIDAGISLIVGDLFFYDPNTIYDPSDPTTEAFLKYGVPLEGHDSLNAGALYRVGNTETAQTALNDPSAFYRKDETVLMTSGTLASAGTGVNVANFGDGNTNAMYKATVSFQATADFLSLVENGQIGILFSAADCANDVLQGTVDTAPEPRSLALIAGGFGLLAGIAVWRRKMARRAQLA